MIFLTNICTNYFFYIPDTGETNQDGLPRTAILIQNATWNGNDSLVIWSDKLHTLFVGFLLAVMMMIYFYHTEWWCSVSFLTSVILTLFLSKFVLVAGLSNQLLRGVTWAPAERKPGKAKILEPMPLWSIALDVAFLKQPKHKINQEFFFF